VFIGNCQSKLPCAGQIQLSGRWFSSAAIDEVASTCRAFPALSRSEIAATLCEHLDWKSPNGKSKLKSCISALDKLEAMGLASPPPMVPFRPRRKPAPVWTAASEPGPELTESAGDWEPVSVVPV